MAKSTSKKETEAKVNFEIDGKAPDYLIDGGNCTFTFCNKFRISGYLVNPSEELLDRLKSELNVKVR
jgi:hypothetical protein